MSETRDIEEALDRLSKSIKYNQALKADVDGFKVLVARHIRKMTLIVKRQAEGFADKDRLHKKHAIRTEIIKIESITRAYYLEKNLTAKRNMYWQGVELFEICDKLLKDYPEDLQDDESCYHQLKDKCEILRRMKLELGMLEARELKLQAGCRGLGLDAD